MMKKSTFWREREKGKCLFLCLELNLAAQNAAGSYYSQLFLTALQRGTAREEAPDTVGVGVRKGQLLHTHQSAGNKDFGTTAQPYMGQVANR